MAGRGKDLQGDHGPPPRSLASSGRQLARAALDKCKKSSDTTAHSFLFTEVYAPANQIPQSQKTPHSLPQYTPSAHSHSPRTSFLTQGPQNLLRSVSPADSMTLQEIGSDCPSSPEHDHSFHTLQSHAPLTPMSPFSMVPRPPKKAQFVLSSIPIPIVGQKQDQVRDLHPPSTCGPLNLDQSDIGDDISHFASLIKHPSLSLHAQSPPVNTNLKTSPSRSAQIISSDSSSTHALPKTSSRPDELPGFSPISYIAQNLRKPNARVPDSLAQSSVPPPISPIRPNAHNLAQTIGYLRVPDSSAQSSVSPPITPIRQIAHNLAQTIGYPPSKTTTLPKTRNLAQTLGHISSNTATSQKSRIPTLCPKCRMITRQQEFTGRVSQVRSIPRVSWELL